MTSPSPPPRSPSPLPPRSRRPKPLTAKGRSISAPESPTRGRNINVKYYGSKIHHDLLKEDSDSSSSSSSSSSRSRSPSPSCSDRDTNELIKAAALALGGDDGDDMSDKKTVTRAKAQRSISEARGQPRRPSLKKTQSTGSKKRSAKNFLRSAVQRSISFGSARPTRDSLASGLFRVTFQKSPEIQEFEKIDSTLKSQLWYVGGELKCLMAQEIARNQQADDDNDKNNNFSSLFDEDALSSLMMSEELTTAGGDKETPPHEVCWRGLEHILEGEDRSQRIRHTVRGIVAWHRDAKEMGYDDPDELRIVSKARTKPDRSKAHKKAKADEKFVKTSGETARESSPQPSRGRRKSKLQKVTLPKLNWSPKPNKRRLSSSNKDAKGEAAKAG